MGAPSAVEHKDVVLALLGAAAGLSGLILVFLGLVVTTLQSYASDTPPQVLRGYKVIASVIGAAFLVGVVAVALATWWLVADQPFALYVGVVVAFVAQLALLIVCAVWALIIFVWKDA